MLQSEMKKKPHIVMQQQNTALDNTANRQAG